MVNYTQSGTWGVQYPINVNPAAGTITIPETGVWRITALLIGEQGNDDKEEMMFLDLDVDGVRGIIALFDVATDKTQYRAFSSSFTRAATSGMVLKLRGRATSGLGTFSVETVSFEVERVF